MESEERVKVFVDEEYSAQFHRRSSSSVHNIVIATIKDTIDEALDGLRLTLEKICPGSSLVSARELMKKEFDYIVDQHSHTILRSIRKAMCIPPDILLPEDSPQKQQYSVSELEEMKRINQELRRKSCVNSTLKAILKAEVKVLDDIDELERKLNKWEELFKQNLSEADEVKKLVECIRSSLNNIEKGYSVTKPRKENPFEKQTLLLNKIV